MASAPSRKRQIVQRIHEHPAHHIDQQQAARRRLVEIGAASRRALGIVGGTQDTILAVDIGEDFLLVGPVIAGGDRIDADGEKFLGDGAGQSETARRVFAIGDDKIQFQTLAQAPQLGIHHIAPRLADNVAQKKNIHRKRRIPCSVKTMSRVLSCGSEGIEEISCPA